MAFVLESIPSAESFSGTLNPARRIYLESIFSEETTNDVRGVTRVSLNSLQSDEQVVDFTRIVSYFTVHSIHSEEQFGSILSHVGFVPPEIPINRGFHPLSVSERFSGVILNQNAVGSGEVPSRLGGSEKAEVRRNLCTDPFGHGNDGQWAAHGSLATEEFVTSLPTVEGLPSGFPAAARHMVGDASNDHADIFVSVENGKTYTVSRYLLIASGTAPDRMAIHNSSSALVLAGTVRSSTGGVWVRDSITFTATETAQWRVRIRQNAEGTLDWYSTGVLIEQADQAGDYFDGSGYVDADVFREDTTGEEVEWDGTPHASQSIRYGLVFNESAYSAYQEFFLPRDYERGKGTTEARIPPLTGFQVLTKVDEGYADVAALDWIIERYRFGVGWEELASGTAIGADRSGNKVWFSIYTDEPIEIDRDWLLDRFRIGVRGRDTSENEFKVPVAYDNGIVTINGQPHEVRLLPGVPYHFEYDSVPSVLHMDAISRKVYFSTERGISHIWATSPNPLATANVKAYEGDGTTPIQIEGEDASINFRVLAGVAEEGTDFLGNRFRNVVTKSSIDVVSALDSEYKDRYWLSKPNPSKFGVEALYFDISDYRGQPSTIDHILLDPATPGVYFQVYHSDEGDPAANEEEWSDKLWTRVPNTYQAKGRFRHPLPQPITARYIKIEFTHLQPRWYSPGDFQKPILYNKHPKWVLDYFMLRTAIERNTEDPFVASQIGIEFNALDLAYDYYLDDLNQDPLAPNELGQHDLTELNNFLRTRTDSSDSIDQETYRRIRGIFESFTQHPATRSAFDFILSTYSLGTVGALQSGERVLEPDYPVEVPYERREPTNFVSSLNREKLVIENNMPVMFFFVPSRHRYRQVVATLEDDRAYFAGVKEIAFQRDHYTKAYDAPLYIEAVGDNVNVERNDFVQKGTTWETHES